MAKTEEDVAQNLKARCLGHLQTMQNEYNVQVAKWKPFLNLYGDAYDAAMKNQQATLQKVKSDIEAEAGLAMLALAFVGGKAIGWISSMIEKEIYPRFSKRIVWKDSFARSPFDVGYEAVRTHDTERAKFFGDVFSGVAGKGFDVGMEKALGAGLARVVAEAPAARHQQASVLVDAIRKSDSATFRTKLGAVLDEEMLNVLNAFGRLYAVTNADMNYGHDLIARLKKMFGATLTPDQLEEIGVELLDKWIDTSRSDYARRWFYYGNNPIMPKLDLLRDRIEKQLWANWILDQDFKVDHRPEKLVGHANTIVGKDRIPIRHVILDRMVSGLLLTDSRLIDLEYKLQRRWGAVVDFIDKEELRDPDDLEKIIAWAKSYSAAASVGPDSMPRSVGTVSRGVTIFP